MPGTIWPMNVTGTNLAGERVQRRGGPAAVVIGRYSTGGLPPQVGSNRSKLKTEDSPVP